MRIAAVRSDSWPAKQADAKIFIMKSRALLGVIGVLASLTFHVPGRAQVPQDVRFEILRTMIADSAAARTVMPLGAKGVELSQSGEIDEEMLREELRIEGRSIQVGEVVTITGIEFSDDKIEVELNDGGTRSRGILDRITFGTGNSTRRITDEDTRPATGSKIVLRFDDKVPSELDSDVLKVFLAPVLDFNKQNFMDSGIESLPTEFQEAVRAKEVIIGMDQSTVIMSKGRPNRRIRESVDDIPREDWIYYENGVARHFVTFERGVVIKVVQY